MSIRCMLIEPQKDAQIIYLEDTEYSTLKGFIGGILGRTPVGDMPGLYILADDEFLYKEGMVFNRKVFGQLFYGTLLIAAEDPNEFDPEGYISMTDEQVAWVNEYMGKAPDISETPTLEEKADYLSHASQVYPL